MSRYGDNIDLNTLPVKIYESGVLMKRVILERKKRGWSQAELARRANVNASSMSRIELGYEPAYPKRGQRIADALGWTGNLSMLFEDVEGY